MRFRLPYTTNQVVTMLTEACRAEVAYRHREFILTDEYRQHILSVAQWLTSENDTSFGLFLCGSAGNGKTTLIRAMQRLLRFLRQNETTSEIRDFKIVSAKELVNLAKQYNNPTKDNYDDVATYKQLLKIEILGIDDMGLEAREAMVYGDIITAIIDVICHRYDEQLCTIISSNLAPDDIAKRYDERIADRFREMMHIINFGTEKSFRKIN